LDPSGLRRLLTRLAVAAGIEGRVTPYDLRHTATSLMAAGGQSAEPLADLLGHVDTRMVFRHYRHPITSSVTTAADYWRKAAAHDLTESIAEIGA
jgi:integrase